MAAQLYELVAAATATRSLRALPGKDALLLEIYSDIGVTTSPTTMAYRGTSPPTVTLSGSGPAAYQLDIKIASTAGGIALGQATYQFALNGGAYSAAAPTTSSPIAIGNGQSFAFSAGTYNTNQSWRSRITSVANYAASNVTEPLVSSFNTGLIVSARAGLPGLNFDTTLTSLGTALGAQIQSLSCSAVTATPDAPFTAIWTSKYGTGNGGTWSMGSNATSDGSTFSFGRGAGTTLDYQRRSMATSLQTLPLWVDDGGWHVFGARYTGTQIEFWVDASKVLALTTLASTGTKAMANANMLRIGASYDDSMVNGDFQSFAIWKRFLTDYEFAVCTRAIQKRFRFI